ncbi:MAG: DNA polymerase III subunit delta' [Crocinitomicaceae bacterium]|jgi:DNA polymerase III subunit delta'|nr:DNA polymerase III subunit delta' [Crocinitomicaceae bacterium]
MQFKDIIGQDNFKEKLIHGVQKNKISHAQLFTGDAGYGALGLSIAYAQYVLCLDKKKNDSCGTCSSCLKINKLQHPDLHFSFPTVQIESKTSNPFLSHWREQVKKNPYFTLFDWTQIIDIKGRQPIISVWESEDIQRKLTLTSYEGGYKVMIIWMADKMNSQCSNKILKILEEPPNKTIFLLVSQDNEILLDTIKSRCQILHLNRVDNAAIKLHLKTKYQLDQEQSESIASFSEGNIIKALELINIDEQEGSLCDDFIGLMRSSYKKNVVEMMNWAEDMAQIGKERQKLFLIYCSHMLRQCIIKNYGSIDHVKVSESELSFINKFSPFINGNNIREFMKSIDDAYYQLDRNANPKILFTLICFQSMRLLHKA